VKEREIMEKQSGESIEEEVMGERIGKLETWKWRNLYQTTRIRLTKR